MLCVWSMVFCIPRKNRGVFEERCKLFCGHWAYNAFLCCRSQILALQFGGICTNYPVVYSSGCVCHNEIPSKKPISKLLWGTFTGAFFAP